MIKQVASSHREDGPCGSTLLPSLSLAIVFVLLALAPGRALAAEESYGFNPLFSLTGNCDTNQVDPVPDPGCPGGTHPLSKFTRPAAVAVDAYGNEYVGVRGNEGGTAGRIDIFDDEGHFISEMPDPHGPMGVAVDHNGTLYVYEQPASGYSEVARYYPSKYEPASGEIEYDPADRVVFANPELALQGSVAVDPTTNRIFVVGSRLKVEEYASADELASPDEPNPLLNTLADSRLTWAHYIAIDGQRRRIFVGFCKDEIFECGILVFKADPPYEFIEEVDGSNTPAGKFEADQARLPLAVDEETGHFFVGDFVSTARIYEFGPNFEYLSTIERTFLQTPYTSQMAISNSILNPDAANRRFLFVPITPFFSGAQEAFAFNPPAGCAPEVEAGSVTAGHLSETEGELKATIDPCELDTEYVFKVEEEGLGEARTVGEGNLSRNALPTTVNAVLTGLRPGTVYRFTVEASNEKGSVVEEGTFATYPDLPKSAGPCPNDAMRPGPSSSLPDCRAFELVTPPDTNGRPVRGGGYPFFSVAALRASPEGNAVSFITEGGSLPGTDGTGSFDGDRYRARRGATGWSTVQFGPTGTETETPHSVVVSPDQGFGFWEALGDGTAVIGGYPNVTNYLQYPDGHSDLIGIGSLKVDPVAVGMMITANGGHVIFSSAVHLEPNAPPDGTQAVYDRTPGEATHVVSLLPPDDATPQAKEGASFVGASRDGAGIAFRIGSSLYLRRNNAVTYEIGENVAFAGVAEGGRRIFYVKGGDLMAFDADSSEVIGFTDTGNAEVVNVAPNGDRAYFVSTTAIAGTGENPNGALPKGGKQNLYLSEEGQTHFVGTVTNRDVEGEVFGVEESVDGLGLWVSRAEGGKVPSKDASRVNPDGSVLLFQSRADLDGRNPAGSRQIYRYDSSSNRLHCISCNPTMVSEGGGASLETFGALNTDRPPIGARIQITNIAPDGKRAVFESKEALVPTDNDGVQDIYEWEEAGVGSCTQAGGCVYLLSSGHSAEDNYLYGMSSSGDDVFFVTGDVLVPADNDTASIYDARVGGGFLTEAEGECIGEGCRPALSQAPSMRAPGSPARGAEDNVPRKCPKGKRKVKRHGKTRCVKKHRQHHRKHRTTSKKKEAVR